MTAQLHFRLLALFRIAGCTRIANTHRSAMLHTFSNLPAIRLGVSNCPRSRRVLKLVAAWDTSQA